MKELGAVSHDETASTISPITGWTRRDWEQLADRMLLALRPFASPNRTGQPAWPGESVRCRE